MSLAVLNKYNTLQQRHLAILTLAKEYYYIITVNIIMITINSAEANDLRICGK